MRATLVYDVYTPKVEERKSEINECIISNFNIMFDHVVLFGESKNQTNYKSTFIHSGNGNRLKFSDFLEFINANRFAEGVAVLTNSDIKLDTKIIELTSDLEKNILLAISRYELSNELAENPSVTQDTWILKFQPIHFSAIAATQFFLGTPGCELRFAEALYAAGFTVYNPCLSIRNTHIQKTPSQHYPDERYFGAYIVTPPCYLEDIKNRDNSREGKLVYLRRP